MFEGDRLRLHFLQRVWRGSFLLLIMANKLDMLVKPVSQKRRREACFAKLPSRAFKVTLKIMLWTLLTSLSAFRATMTGHLRIWKEQAQAQNLWWQRPKRPSTGWFWWCNSNVGLTWDQGVPWASGQLLWLPTSKAAWWNISNVSHPIARPPESPCTSLEDSTVIF